MTDDGCGREWDKYKIDTLSLQMGLDIDINVNGLRPLASLSLLLLLQAESETNPKSRICFLAYEHRSASISIPVLGH